ncbi:MAG TPA: hypothetical protein VEA80_02170 [Vitreimonas sp.]|uniref:hypothetical protein n=1 Tax=Vitreimonas sp. TaxID=3069702 RepID=UPI002D70C3A2|nr:hypothetical protein [Vitreimonas sp.]HYD86257.1 hypothetical protein [Vitreimonas sp.]
MIFERALDGDFIKALNRLYVDGSWWKDLLEDEDVFIAVRGNYLNAYFQGCSLAKITFEQGEVCTSTHYKYLLRSIRSPYIKAKAGKFQYPDAWKDPGSVFAQGLHERDTLKAAAEVYSRGTEREFVSNVITSKVIKDLGNVIDVEIAFSVPSTGDTDDATTPRIDLAALERTSDGVQLVMYEAKLFQNQELRSGSEQVPVLGQIAQYEAVLREHHDDVRRSYLNTARIVLAIDGLPVPRKLWARRIVENEQSFSVSPKARLIIGNFDNDQKHGKAWKPHREKLERNIGASRIFAAKAAKTIGEQISRAST